MNPATALGILLKLGVPVVRTSEASAVLRQSNVAASQTLRRLALAELIQPLRHGLYWLSKDPIDPWVALDYLALPYPAYGSLYSALYLHGALSQIPAVHYAATLGRTQKVKTSVGTFSLHQIDPKLFDGFETAKSGAKLATLEKAVFDVAYLSSGRSRLFSNPPELELPRRLRMATFRPWIEKIEHPLRAAHVERQLQALLRKAR